MIGVMAKGSEHDAVREFFELFKTPWEFYRSDRTYEVLIVDAEEYDRAVDKVGVGVWSRSRAAGPSRVGESPAREDSSPPILARAPPAEAGTPYFVNRPEKYEHHSPGLTVVYGGQKTPFDERMKIGVEAQSVGAVLRREDERLPVHGNCLMFAREGIYAWTDEATGRPAVAARQAEGMTIVRVGFDLFGEVRRLLGVGQPREHAGEPALDLHIAWLRDLISNSGNPVVEIPPLTQAHDLAVCLTHDVDHPGIRLYRWDHTMFGFLHRAILGSVIDLCRGRGSLRKLGANWLAALALPFVHLGVAKDFWAGFDRYLELEMGLGSTFFFLPRKGHAGLAANGVAPGRRASRYEAADVSAQVKKLVAAGCEVGLHGIDAWADIQKAREESGRVSEVTGNSIDGVRMHWLYFSEQSPKILEQAGFSYDSTFGYNQTIGFRAGTAQAYKPLDVSHLLELPLHVMDTALFYPAYMNLSAAQARQAVGKVVDQVARFGGVLTVNWHDRSIAPERFWDEFYAPFLDNLKGRNAWFPTAGQAVAWFRRRRAASLEVLPLGGRQIKVKASVPPCSTKLPGMRLRVHKTGEKSPNDLFKRQPARAYTDIPLNDSLEVVIAT